MHVMRRSAGVWGPLLFGAAAAAASRLQPGYSHRHHHISGLAAAGQRSALVMVPGFAALGAATLVMPVPGRAIGTLARIAGVGVLAAGAIPASQPRCPQPMVDPDATPSDLVHGIASVTAFAAWTAIPFVASSLAGPSWYRSLNRGLRLSTSVGFAGAALTTRFDTPYKGVAQRGFLASVFAWYIATTIRSVIDGD